MTLRLKINLIVGVLMLLFLAAVIALQLRSMRASVNEEVIAANRVAAQLLNRTAWRYAAQGPQAMLLFLQGVGRVRSNDIALYDDAGQALYHSPPSPYKAGRDAPDWFERLVAPPPSEQSIEFPGGKLVVSANASRAAIDAWDDMLVLVSAGLALVVLVSVLVFWLVGRALRPFGDVVAALNQIEAGRFDVALGPLPGREAATIATAFNRMTGVLREHIETERRAVLAERRLSDSREVARWVDRQIEDERRAIARELHDEFGQSVTAMRSMALSIAQRAAGRDEASAQAARLIAEESSRLYDAMHGLIPRLAPLVLDSLGLAEALEDLAERTRRSHPELQLGLHVDRGGAEPLPPEAALAVYRAAQEGLTNALRHAGARRVDVRLCIGAGEARLEVRDDGRGLAEGARSAPGHYGLRWLAERVEALGGVLAVESVDPHGVRLIVRLPLGAAAADSADAAGTPALPPPVPVAGQAARA